MSGFLAVVGLACLVVCVPVCLLGPVPGAVVGALGLWCLVTLSP